MCIAVPISVTYYELGMHASTQNSNSCNTIFLILFKEVSLLKSTVRCRYNAVSFLQNSHERHSIARPSGQGMRCRLWVQPVIDILPQLLQRCVR